MMGFWDETISGSPAELKMIMKEGKTFDKSFWKSFGWFLLIALVICSLPWILATHSLWIDFTDKGQIGDTIGGIMGPFIAIAAAALTFIAFWVQYKANIQQRNDIAIERFESNLFEMIHIQQEIINGLLVEEKDSDGKTLRFQKGRDVFQFIYETAKDKIEFPDGEANYTLSCALKIWPELKMHLDKAKVMWSLDHYFRHLYRIFKYINDVDELNISEEKKYEYASIVRATLSQYELILLFYNGFSHPKFKVLIEKYALFNNIRPNLMADAYEHSLYKTKMQDHSNFGDEDNKDMRTEYKQSAFIRKRGCQ